MRRKSERTAGKKSKPSPEKKEKVEKPKRTKTRRRKQSSSSGSESVEEANPVVTSEVVETKTAEPPKLEKEESPEESQEQVWQVKAAESSGNVGEIKKLKICLTRPPSTPERVDRSPRSKRKLSRATSSSDTQSVEGEDKKKSKHRSKRGTTDSKDAIEKIDELQVDEAEINKKEKVESCVAQIDNTAMKNEPTNEAPVSTTNEEPKCSKVESTDNIEEKKNEEERDNEIKDDVKGDDVKEDDVKEDDVKEDDVKEDDVKEDDVKGDDGKEVDVKEDDVKEDDVKEDDVKEDDVKEDDVKEDDVKEDDMKEDDVKEDDQNHDDEKKNTKTMEISPKNTDIQEKAFDADSTVDSVQHDIDKDQTHRASPQKSPVRKRSLSAEKSEILELHAEESRCESSEVSFNEPQEAKPKTILDEDKDVSLVSCEVSTNKSPTEISGEPGSNNNDDKVTINENNVVEGTTTVEKESTLAPDTNQDIATKSSTNADGGEISTHENKPQVPQDVLNGETTPLVINRKRRWGSRASKLLTQKSITISTDVLKEIIPDVKPVEFDEVIEEKKHKRIEVPEKFDRPILPKIIIDNTESIEVNKKEQKVEDRDKENVKIKESNVAPLRKISIVKDDSIIARPPSPPKHKQSNILYITNLVRPFTLSQLRNLLQRTGKIVDNELWIDRIKSKCYVKYETEDHAIETRHALHGVTWPVSNPKQLHVDFSSQEDFDKAKAKEENDNAQVSTMPGTVEDWLREQDMKREKGELEKPWERKAAMREWDVGKNEKNKEITRQDKIHRDERPLERRRHRTPERSPEPARKFKKKEEEAPAKLLDDLFRKTKTTPCIYWLPLSAETIAVKEEQRRQHMAEHERRLQELRRTHRRH